MKKKILIVAHNEFEDTELIATRDVLLRKGIDVDLISLTNSIDLISAYNLKIKADDIIKNILSNLDKYDALFLPGGSGVKNIDNTKEIDEIINHFYVEEKIIGSICAAPILLAKRGVLKNKNATCFPDDKIVTLLKNNGVNVIDDEFIVDDKIITGRDMKASINFARKLSELILI